MMKNYKHSQYNIVSRIGDNIHLVYNTLSSAVALINDLELNALLNDIFDEGDFLKQCIHLGLVVPEDEQEFEKVMAIRNMNNFNSRRAGVQILTTTGCNARCFYCYEERYEVENMDDNSLEGIIAFLKKFFIDFEDVSIAWFGGEPLVRFDVIEKISQEIIPFCEKNHIRYRANMITNAVLLDDEIIKKLVDYKVSEVQITIDGYKEEHDKRKNYQISKFGYDNILQNIKKLTDSKIKVLVRFNIDRINLQGCLKAIEDLSKIVPTSEYIWPYLAPLYSDKGYDGCLTKEELSNAFKLGFDKLIDCGYIQTINGLPMNFSNASCAAKMMNNYVISPKGIISKCEHLLGYKDDIVGNVWDGITFNKSMALWNQADVPEDCKKCPYLPLCQAGCYAAEKRGFGYGRCSYISFINDAVVYAADKLLKVSNNNT